MENGMLDKLTEHFTSLIDAIGEDPGRDGLRGTPDRAARAIEFLTGGYREDLESIVNQALFDVDSSEMVIVKGIELYSLCEHHILPFFGQCHVGYIPDGKVLGLSKVARIVDMYARRLQIQEKLTFEIAQTILELTGAHGVGVFVDARHLCMMMRGVEKQGSSMRTSAMLGTFRSNASTRAEFLSLINQG